MERGRKIEKVKGQGKARKKKRQKEKENEKPSYQELTFWYIN